MTVTPVLADQLEDRGGAPSGCSSSCAPIGSRPATPTPRTSRRRTATACRAEAAATAARSRGSRRSTATCCDLFAGPAAEGRVELIASAATHAVLPLLATRAGRRLQIDAGLRSHRRGSVGSRGFWLPECAYEPGLERLLAERGARATSAPTRARTSRSAAALAPIATAVGPIGVHDRLGGGPLALVAGRLPVRPRLRRLPSQVAARRRARGRSAATVRPERRGGRAPAARSEFAAAAAARLRRFAADRGRRGLIVFAIDTELLGHWWWEGPAWLAEVLAAALEHGLDLVTLSEALPSATSPSRGRCGPRAGVRARTCAPGTRRRSPTSPGRRGGSSCGCCVRSRGGLAGPRPGAGGARAARRPGERLGVPRPPPPGGRLPLPARHRPRSGPARGHRLAPPRRPIRGCGTWRRT